jgi:hypothetical protein
MPSDMIVSGGGARTPYRKAPSPLLPSAGGRQVSIVSFYDQPRYFSWVPNETLSCSSCQEGLDGVVEGDAVRSGEVG